MKNLLSAIAATVIILALISCSSANSGSSSETVADYPVSAFDTTINQCPQRVISLVPYVTEIIYELGSDAQLAGVSDDCKTQRDVERFGSCMEPLTEKIVQAKPDIIFSTDMLPDSAKTAFNKADITVVTVIPAARYSDLSEVYKNVAKAMSGYIAGSKNARNTFNRIDKKVKNAAESATPSVKLAAFYSPSVIIPNGSVASDLIAIAGGINVADSAAATDSDIKSSGVKLIICNENDAENLSKRFDGIKIVKFDISMLESRGSSMANAVKALKSAIDSTKQK